MIKLRLARVEKLVWQVDARPCTLCWGEPFGVIIEDLIERADRPGFRSERRLDDGQLDRVMPDLLLLRQGRTGRSHHDAVDGAGRAGC